MQAFITSERGGRWLAGMAVAGTALFVGALVGLMLPYSAVLARASPYDLTCLQVPFSAGRAAEIIESYGPEGRAAARRLHVPGDTLFPLGYALLYAGLVGLVARRQEGWWLRAGLVAMLFSVGAMVFDWIENAFILRMIAAYESGIPEGLALAGSAAASLKYGLLSVLTPLYSLAAAARAVVAGRARLGAGAWVTYGVVSLVMVASVAQLVGQVLPCLFR